MSVDREALVERMAEELWADFHRQKRERFPSLCPNPQRWRELARAALAIAEPAVRAERDQFLALTQKAEAAEKVLRARVEVLEGERDQWRAWLFDVVSGICKDEHDGATLCKVAQLLEPKGSEIAMAVLNDAEVERIARAALEPRA